MKKNIARWKDTKRIQMVHMEERSDVWADLNAGRDQVWQCLGKESSRQREQQKHCSDKRGVSLAPLRTGRRPICLNGMNNEGKVRWVWAANQSQGPWVHGQVKLVHIASLKTECGDGKKGLDKDKWTTRDGMRKQKWNKFYGGGGGSLNTQVWRIAISQMNSRFKHFKRPYT